MWLRSAPQVSTFGKAAAIVLPQNIHVYTPGYSFPGITRYSSSFPDRLAGFVGEAVPASLFRTAILAWGSPMNRGDCTGAVRPHTHACVPCRPVGRQLTHGGIDTDIPILFSLVIPRGGTFQRAVTMTVRAETPAPGTGPRSR